MKNIVKIISYINIIIFVFVCYIKNINASEIDLIINFNNNDNLYAYETTINYDENIFEEITENSFSSLKVISYNKENHKLVFILDNEVNELHLKLITKSNNKINSVITFKDIVGSNGSEEIRLNDKNYDLKIEKNGKFSVKEFDNENNNELVSKNVFLFNSILLGILLISLILLLWFNINIVCKKKITKIIFNSILISFFLISSIVFVLSYIFKGDMNYNLQDNYNDTKKLIDYLTNVNDVDKHFVDGFTSDINFDGKLSIMDAARSIEKVNSYTLEITNLEIPAYINKDTKYKLNFTANVYPQIKIKKIVINKKKYDVINTSNNDYEIELDSISSYGNVNLKITKFILENNKKIKQEFDIKTYILKDEPSVSDYSYDTNNNIVKFNLIDNDKTIKEASLIIKDLNDNEVFTKSIKSNKNVINIDLDNGEYKLIIDAYYDLDSNTNDINEYKKELYIKDIKIINDYNISIKNLELKNVDKTDKIISFTFDNSDKYIIKNIKVNNEIYSVEKQNNKYIVYIKYNDDNLSELKINSVILENEKEIEINDSLKLPNLKPTVENTEKDETPTNDKTNNQTNNNENIEETKPQTKPEENKNEENKTEEKLEETKPVETKPNFTEESINIKPNPDLDKNIVYIDNANDLVKTINKNQNANILLTKDIDLSKYKLGDAIIQKEFKGNIDGNNHKLTNNVIPIFSKINNGNIENLIIENSNIKLTNDDIGVLAKRIEYSNLKNIIIKNSNIESNGMEIGLLSGYVSNSHIVDIHVVNSSISGDSRIGGLAGYLTNHSKIEECSVNVSITANKNSGNFIGEINSSTVKNSYSLGKINSKDEANRIGGFIGYINSSTILNNYSKVEIKTSNKSGGFIGQATGDVNILNNISFSYSKNNVYKFDGESLSNVILSQNYTNNYELKDVDGLNTSLRNSDFENKIILVSSKNINKEFFEKKLSWSSKVWNLNNGKLPKLSNHDPNKIQSIK